MYVHVYSEPRFDYGLKFLKDEPHPITGAMPVIPYRSVSAGSAKARAIDAARAKSRAARKQNKTRRKIA